MSIGYRILQISKHFNLSGSAFSRRLGYDLPQKVNRIMSKPELNPSADMLSDIANAFPEVNCYWLLTGKGDMLISERTKISTHNASVGRMITVDENATMRSQLELLTRMIADKDKIIQLLELQMRLNK